MIKFNYKDVAKEQGWNFNSITPIVEYPVDYFYYKEVAKEINPSTVMLDIGCGSGEKAVRYFSNAKKVVMLDNEPEMLTRVQANVEKILSPKEREIFTTKLADGTGKLDFPDESFDMVVSRHCGGNMSEVYRVLKKGGIFISEDVDHEDCLEIKQLFGRGQGYENLKTHNLEKQKIMNECLDLKFSDIELKNFYYIEYYPDVQQLKYLLTRTPILEYFDETTDDEILNQYIAQNTTEKGIKLIRRLYAFRIVK
ncbi:MAG TPA: hypothetical protein DD621_00710 [Clostridiales bacterium]|nr:hypothetical protein [Clostridiales bacterium]